MWAVLDYRWQRGTSRSRVRRSSLFIPMNLRQIVVNEGVSTYEAFCSTNRPKHTDKLRIDRKRFDAFHHVRLRHPELTGLVSENCLCR